MSAFSSLISRIQGQVAAFAIIAACVASYWNSGSGVFVFDDIQHIVNNSRIRTVWPPWVSMAGSSRPVVSWSLAINYWLGGLDPGGYHAVNVAIHSAAALCLFGVMRRTLLLSMRLKAWRARADSVALPVALLWALHPLQTQSVTYIIQRGESMMGLCLLAVFYCIARTAHDGSRRHVASIAWSMLTVALCFVGMGCKAVMVVAPFAALLYERTFFATSLGALLRRRWLVYVGMMSAWSILWVGGVIQGLYPSASAATRVGFGLNDISPWHYALTQTGVVLHYLWLAVWPSSLCFDYAWPVVTTLKEAMGSALIVFSLLVLVVVTWVRNPSIGFVSAFFFLLLSPTSSIIPIRDAAAEHRMYLPLVSPIVLLVVFAAHVASRARSQNPAARWKVYFTLFFVLSAVLGLATIQRNRVYHSAEALWTDVARKRPDNARAWNNLGTLQARTGRLDLSEASLRRAIRLDPRNAEAHYNLGLTLARKGDWTPACNAYERAITLAPDYGEAHNNAAIAMHQLGRFDDSIRHFKRAAELLPERADVLFNLGAALVEAKRATEAEPHLRRVLELEPGHADATRLLDLCRAP
ncbi:MAG: tetratricopeptide repeat protein [Planctomycetes bacterium]|nr:tetratricopeptide repeat protein [Planctomycetota bacterium]